MTQAMGRKNRFPPEPDTEPELRKAPEVGERTSGLAPKKRRHPSEAPTDPPPPPPPPTTRRGGKSTERPRTSGVQQRKGRTSDTPAATVDEVVADLSKDPRREKDD